MIGTMKLLGLGAAGALLVSATPTPSEFRLSEAALDLLDPSRVLSALCGQGRAGGEVLRQRLQFAMAAAPAPAAREGAPRLYDGLGGIHRKISTKSPLAQRYFDQGLALTYGFNHAEAIRAFQQAQTLDPGCAMCWWGEAFAQGPNINAPYDPEVNARVIEVIGRAMALRDRATPAERALIEAVAKRYSPKPDADRAALDQAFADAMLGVAGRFPKDDDISVIAAEAVMDTRPWDYWEADRRTPKGRIGDAVALVERTLARNPSHTQATHLYIHLMEASANPAKAEAAADRLATPLAPAAGHLVHMPGHLYYRVGRFKDALRVNVAAAKADEAYLRTSDDKGLYRFGYYPHNVHFIVTSAQMAGDMGTAVAQARKLSTILNTDISAAMPWVQPVDAAPYLAYAQFAAPAEILALPAPDRRLPYVTAMWHYARAVAHAQKQDAKAFDGELAAIRRIAETTDFKPMVDQLVPAPDLLRLAGLVARGRYAYVQGDFAKAAAHYQQAATIEDGIRYMEPPFWYYPVRQSLGAALYRAGDYQGARQAFEAALAAYPGNGWALYGLAQTQRQLGDRPAALATRRAFERVWIGKPNWLTIDRI